MITFFSHAKKIMDILVVSIPELIFLMCIIGQMAILIIAKWLAWDASTSQCAPQIMIS